MKKFVFCKFSSSINSEKFLPLVNNNSSKCFDIISLACTCTRCVNVPANGSQETNTDVDKSVKRTAKTAGSDGRKTAELYGWRKFFNDCTSKHR